MTPREKAIDIVNKILLVNSVNYIEEDTGLWETKFGVSDGDAKQYALIAADEALNASTQLHIMEYWEQVKKEIKKI